MLRTLTYIHFRAQWQFLAQEQANQRYERQVFQDFFIDLNRGVGDYDDFSYRPNRCELAKIREGHAQGAQAFSKILFTADQLTVTEEWADLQAGRFRDKFAGILDAWFRFFPFATPIAQRFTLRGLVQPDNYEESSTFIADRVMQMGPALSSALLGTPQQVGFSLSCARDLTSDGGRDVSRGTNNACRMEARVNSWRDNRSVWVEVNGSTPFQRSVDATVAESSAVAFDGCKSFLENEIVGGFLTAYDTPAPVVEEPEFGPDLSGIRNIR